MPKLSDITDLLRRWDRWKVIDATPERVDALERRVEELEAKLQRAPGQACPSCGAWEFRVTESRPDETFGVVGGRRLKYRCGTCGFEDEKMSKD